MDFLIPPRIDTEQALELEFSGKIDVLSIRDNRLLRSHEKRGYLSSLGKDEYFSFSLHAQNNGRGAFAWENAWVVVDGGAPWHYGSNTIRPGENTFFPVYYVNMKTCMNEGTHTAVWYFDGQEMFREQFTLTWDMDWESVFDFPTAQQIRNHNRTSRIRSPYLSGWFSIPQYIRYTEYTIDFKADHLPKGTYCCLFNGSMDYSALNKRYASVMTEYNGIHTYSGFQNINDGTKVSILSFWDIFCKDASGNAVTLRAKRVHPKTTSYSEEFWGEGTGAHCTVPYPWKPKHWYRMHLKCRTSPQTGKTVVEQWVCDLETGKYTLLCGYDTHVENATFHGPTAVFLENYLTEHSGDVRTMEVRNVRYLNADTNQWQTTKNAHFRSTGGLPDYEGSYNFGVSGDRFWMITSGVGGDWFHNGKGRKDAYLTSE